jgi:hypothetical protein
VIIAFDCRCGPITSMLKLWLRFGRKDGDIFLCPPPNAHQLTIGIDQQAPPSLIFPAIYPKGLSGDVNMTRRVIVIIDDGPGMRFVVKELLQKIGEQFDCDEELLKAEPVLALPDRERTRSQSPCANSIESLEGFLKTRADEVAACLVDCDLGFGEGLERSIELCQAAQQGETPFDRRFRDVPIAMFTAHPDIHRIAPDVAQRFRFRVPVFPKVVRGEVSADLTSWLADALGIT